MCFYLLIWQLCFKDVIDTECVSYTDLQNKNVIFDSLLTTNHEAENWIEP